MKFACSPAYTFSKSERYAVDKKIEIYPDPFGYTDDTFTTKNKYIIIKSKDQSKNNSPTLKNVPSYTFGGANRFQNENPSTTENCSLGSGTYNIKTDINKVPCYSFGKEKKCKNLHTSYSPGPIYNTTAVAGSFVPKIGFGCPHTSNPQRPTTPAPGDYEVRTQLGKGTPMFSFNKEKRNGLSRTTTPGPGEYKIRKSPDVDAKYITISPKVKTLRYYDQTPGPGAYTPDIKLIKLRYPTYRIGTAKRMQLYNSSANSPSPNNYYPKHTFGSTKPKSPAWKMGTSSRPALYVKTCTPGPGGYNIMSKTTSGPKFSLRGKYKLKLKTDSPGPANYNQDTKFITSKEPAWTIGMSLRDDELKRVKRDNFPGPGNYTVKVRKKHSGNIKFGKEVRDTTYVKRDNFPGPGQYRIPCEFDTVTEYTRQQGKFDERYKYV